MAREVGAASKQLEDALASCAGYVSDAARLEARYRAGEIRVHVPPGLLDLERPFADAIAAALPASHAVLQAASNGLFYSLPVAYEPRESVGPYLATVDRDAAGGAIKVLDPR